jgi:predicted DNA-binding transcriptional regulator AlpA
MRLINRKALMKMLGIASDATIDSMERRGLLPARIRVSDNRVMWDLDEVERAISERPRGLNASLTGRTR